MHNQVNKANHYFTTFPVSLPVKFNLWMDGVNDSAITILNAIIKNDSSLISKFDY